MYKKFEDHSKTDIIPLVVLILLIIFCFGDSIVLSDTIDITLYKPISPLFWITLTYALIYPFLKKDEMNSNTLILWGGITFTLFWSYFTAVDPELRYWDSFYHSGTAQLMAIHGANPYLEIYIAWPGAFILHLFLKFITGLSFLALSKILAILFVFFTGILLMKMFSLFFDERNALTCLFVFTLLPFSFVSHYSPQTVAYFLYLLVFYVLLKDKINLKWKSIFIVMCIIIVPIHPTTTLIMTSILTFILVSELLREKKFVTTEMLISFLVAAGGWWMFQAGTLEALTPRFKWLFEAIITGEFRFERGIFFSYNQPFYSILIRNTTLAFLFVLIVPSFFNIAKNLIGFRKGYSKKEDAFFVPIMGGSFLITLIMSIAERGLWGERLFPMIAPILSIFGVRNISKFSKTVNIRRVAVLLTIVTLVLTPLNFIGLNWSESLKQTTASETSAIFYLRSQSIHDEILFSDSLTLYRFMYTSLDGTNRFLFAEASSNPHDLIENERLIQVSWTYFIRNEKTKLLLYAYHGMEIERFEELNFAGINKCYDNSYVKIYKKEVSWLFI